MVGGPEAIHVDGLSAFRPCGRDLVEFFNSTGWSLYGKRTQTLSLARHPPPRDQSSQSSMVSLPYRHFEQR